MLARREASPGDDSLQAQLATALKAGIITQATHDDQLRAHRGETGLVAAPTKRILGGKLVADHSGLWTWAAGPFSSVKEALAAKDTVGHGNWCWNQDGDRKVQRCNAHVNCPVKLRCVPLDGAYHLEVLNLAHSLEDKQKKRKNSALTYEQHKDLLKHVEAGKRPKQSMDSAALLAIAADPDAKKPEGGVEGALQLHSSCHVLPLRPIFATEYRNILLHIEAVLFLPTCNSIQNNMRR